MTHLPEEPSLEQRADRRRGAGDAPAPSLSRRAMLKTAGWLGGAAALLGPEPWRVRSAEAALWRITLDLNKEQDRQRVRGQWRVASGLVPGEPNEGLVAGLQASPARLADYDDSAWEICNDVREGRSRGFTFAWWRITLELPEEVDGVPLAGAQVFFETNIDNNGEVWLDGDLPSGAGMAGHNAHQRVMISPSAVPGARHVIACLAANGPLAAPRGGVWIRYTTLVFETPN